MSEPGVASVDHEPQAAPDKESPDWLEITATVLLGIAAVLIAWSTYQAQLWGGVQDTRNTNSALAIVDAADDLGRADAVGMADQLLFGDYILRPDEDEANLLLGQMSEPGQIASERWFITDEVRPFDGDGYVYTIYGEGLAKREAAFVLFDEASNANSNGDAHVLAATITALVLFLAGVSLVLKGHLTRVLLVTGSGVILAGVIVYLISLPRAGSAASEDKILADAQAAASAEFAALVEQAEIEDAEALARAEAGELDDADPDGDASAEDFLTEGGTAFAVYIDLIEASASSGDLNVDFAETITFFDEAGVAVGVGPLDCDEGAAEGLGLDPGDYSAAAAYFASQEEANAFAIEYEIPADNIVEVLTFC